jgi:hypothetical protein
MISRLLSEREWEPVKAKRSASFGYAASSSDQSRIKERQDQLASLLAALDALRGDRVSRGKLLEIRVR